MEDLILYIVKALVKNPAAVTVELGEEQDGVTTYNLTVAEEDKGYVIGKQGKVAKAIRAIVKTAAMKENKKVRVYIV
ncbi:MAG: KH domain-containing protein [Clostridia bacterium]|nr:KH domain-containing protein [Clostridia bacterium]MBQ1965186.1 KH domain-containing protein [Clostridia bacterium]MBQ5743131.1 KH domain-containing protein [Clostridia bacterium]